MVFTGAALALLLWIAVLAFQKDTSGAQNTTESNDQIAANPIPEEYAITPASVQTITETNQKIVVSGIGVSNAGISLANKEENIANSKIDADGKWVLSLNSGLLAETTKLDLIMITPDGHQVRSDQSVFVIKGESERSLVLLTEPGAQSRVLQTPFASFPKTEGFELESIDYDNSGGVIFSGNSNEPGRVRIYANENQVGESRVDRNGRWTLIFGSIMPLGEYNISAEFIPDGGAENRKLTLPFSRIEPLFEAEGSPKILIQHLDDRIQMGRALYGGGYQYTVIYSPDALIE
jgi:hypothetical protein